MTCLDYHTGGAALELQGLQIVACPDVLAISNGLGIHVRAL